LVQRFDIHNHTCYSNLRLIDSTVRPRELIDRAIELGLAGIAVTDHEALGCHVELDRIQNEYKEKYPDFKIVRGNEIYLTDTRDAGQYYYHFILLALDGIGHEMLRKLSSTAWINSYFDRGMERVPTLKSEIEDVITEYGAGHIHGSCACLAGECSRNLSLMIQAEEDGDKVAAKQYHSNIVKFVKWCKKTFGSDFSLEVAPGRSPEQVAVNSRMPALAKVFNVPIVIGCDTHYLKKEDRYVHKAFLNSKGGEREVDAFYEYAYLQSEDEIIENLAETGLDYEELCENSMRILDKCQEYTLARNQQVPQVDVHNYPKQGKNEHSYDTNKYPTLDYLMHSDNVQERYWINYCQERLDEKGLSNETYLSRLEEEADINKTIGDKLGTCMFAYPIFLQHYINLFWECGSTVGAGRGSACSGLNHWLLGVTQLDPIVNDLPYWRYSNKERLELGDIDIDLAPSKRELVFEKIREERGQLGCVQVCTYGTVTSKAAVKIACRGYRSESCPNGIELDEAEYLSSLIPSERGFVWSLEDCFYGNEEKDRKPNQTLIQEVEKFPGLKDVMLNICGLVTQRGIHASGVNFYSENPYKTACFMKAKNGAITTQYSLHDAEYCSDVKLDFLVTEIQDVITQCIQLLQEAGEMDPNLTLRQAYDKYLHPTVLPLDDDKLWEAASSGSILKLFQFDTQVGGQTIKLLKPTTPQEMANCNSIMRLMPAEKGAETPTDRYYRMKNDISQWYAEMNDWGLSEEEQKALEPYYLPAYASPAQQEDMMILLMEFCGFSLSDANYARKVCAKKKMSEIPNLHKMVIEGAPNENLGNYLYETAIKPQLGYSFSKIHSLAYSYIGLQTVYLATYFPRVYWNTACLRIDAGLEEEASTDYAKVAKAIGNMVNAGVKVTPVDINKSGYLFEPDEKNNAILYGMKSLNGVGGEMISEIINNRPYNSFEDFLNRTTANKTTILSLVKAGAFDEFGDRVEIMRRYICIVSEPKKRVTMQNFASLAEKRLLPNSLGLQERTFNFNKSLKSACKFNADYFALDSSKKHYNFYMKNFDESCDKTEVIDNHICLSKKVWKSIYDKVMKPAKDYINNHKDELLDKLNGSLFQEQWNKYASGSISAWEMDALGYYYHDHELVGVRQDAYGIVPFKSLSSTPEVERTFRSKGREFSTYKTSRIMGVVIGKNNTKGQIDILTLESGVVTVKFSLDYFAKYNRRISDTVRGQSKVMENGWFLKGTPVVVNGYRSGDMFRAKSYKSTKSHQLYRITQVNPNGTIEMTNSRYGDSE
jgi:DNA polymerase III subunit alpha